MESISKVTRRVLRQLTLARHCPGVKIIEGKSERGAHLDRPEILDQMRDQKERGAGGGGDGARGVRGPSRSGVCRHAGRPVSPL